MPRTSPSFLQVMRQSPASHLARVTPRGRPPGMLQGPPPAGPPSESPGRPRGRDLGSAGPKPTGSALGAAEAASRCCHGKLRRAGAGEGPAGLAQRPRVWPAATCHRGMGLAPAASESAPARPHQRNYSYKRSEC